MKSIILYSYSKCSTCRKASKWLDQNSIDYKLIDIIKKPPEKLFLELALEQFASNRKKLFNTRWKSFKLIDFDIENLTNKKIINMLSEDGKLIKRPFLILDKSKIIVGFNESEYIENFLHI